MSSVNFCIFLLKSKELARSLKIVENLVCLSAAVWQLKVSRDVFHAGIDIIVDFSHIFLMILHEIRGVPRPYANAIGSESIAFRPHLQSRISAIESKCMPSSVFTYGHRHSTEQEQSRQFHFLNAFKPQNSTGSFRTVVRNLYFSSERITTPDHFDRLVRLFLTTTLC